MGQLKPPPQGKPEARLGSEVDGRYRLLSVIGAGAMGTVYRVRHLALDRVFAMKVMNSRMAVSDEMVTRFRREAMAAASIGHPHIIDVTDMGQLDDGTAYIVMEHLSGTDLATHVGSQGPLSVEQVVRMATQLCSALSAVHARRIVHRDLKPENLMLVHSSRDDVVLKVLDFGICKLLDPPEEGPYAPLTRTHVTMGTPQFMAPEQFSRDAPIDARTDIHAAGAILYFALCGRPLYESRDLAHLCWRIAVEPPPSVLAAREDVPRELDAVVSRACAKSPQDRFQSAEEMGAALCEVPLSPHAGGPDSRVRLRPLAETMDSVPVLRGVAGAAQPTEREFSAPEQPQSAAEVADAAAAHDGTRAGEDTAFESAVTNDRRRSDRALWLIGAAAFGLLGLAAVGLRSAPVEGDTAPGPEAGGEAAGEGEPAAGTAQGGQPELREGPPAAPATETAQPARPTSSQTETEEDARRAPAARRTEASAAPRGRGRRPGRRGPRRPRPAGSGASAAEAEASVKPAHISGDAVEAVEDPAPAAAVPEEKPVQPKEPSPAARYRIPERGLREVY